MIETKGDEDCENSSPAANLMLVTANVGSLFEDPDRLLKLWQREFLLKVEELRPDFLALHLQEVGGKTYEKSLEYVQEFIRSLCDAKEMEAFTSMHIYMDEDFKSAEHFTALGNLYFVNKSLENVKIWDFLAHEWNMAHDKVIHTGNIENIATKEKAKFPQHFFPECKWSRKGFMRSRWAINGTVLDFVNIHLFHDASNLAACEKFPSVYCKTRRRALVYTLERFHLDKKNLPVPYFVFGDFNFRCDTEGVIAELTKNLTTHRIQNVVNDNIKIHYRNSNGDNVLTIGKKEFNHADHQLKFKEDWLKQFDKELEALKEVLVEYPIPFPPSYPFEEDPEMPTDYMSTRCPSWCDRILMSPHAKEIISDEAIAEPYNVIGENVCMGDHKPVYLNIRLKPNQGTYRCCDCSDISRANDYCTSTSHLKPACIPAYSRGRGARGSAHYCDILRKLKAEAERISKRRSDDRIGEGKSIGERPPSGDKRASVSINIIDADNMYVCTCAHTQAPLMSLSLDGNICTVCNNTIKQEAIGNDYRLISERLMLSNKIIVNRLDTQHLNIACPETNSWHQEPYTPESAESHSPCPEVNRIGLARAASARPGCALNRSSSQNSKDPRRIFANNVDLGSHAKANFPEDVLDRCQRGVVTPVQLKTRLEDLQKSSMQGLGQECNGGMTANVDVNNAVRRRQQPKSFCCCNIN